MNVKEIEENAVGWVEKLIAEMLEGEHDDNRIILGELSTQSGSEIIQVQLVVTRNESDFIDE